MRMRETTLHFQKARILVQATRTCGVLGALNVGHRTLCSGGNGTLASPFKSNLHCFAESVKSFVLCRILRQCRVFRQGLRASDTRSLTAARRRIAGDQVVLLGNCARRALGWHGRSDIL